MTLFCTVTENVISCVTLSFEVNFCAILGSNFIYIFFLRESFKFWWKSCRYIHFVKGYFRPVLTKEAEMVISNYYQLQRRSATGNAGSTWSKFPLLNLSFVVLYFYLINCTVFCDSARTTVRMLESLIRLAQGTLFSLWNYALKWISCFIPQAIDLAYIAAHARLMFRNEVTRLDAITAILCIESSMTTSAIVDSVGNALHSNFAENPDLECILASHFCMYLSFLKLCPCIFTYTCMLNCCEADNSSIYPLNL